METITTRKKYKTFQELWVERPNNAPFVVRISFKVDGATQDRVGFFYPVSSNDTAYYFEHWEKDHLRCRPVNYLTANTGMEFFELLDWFEDVETCTCGANKLGIGFHTNKCGWE